MGEGCSRDHGREREGREEDKFEGNNTTQLHTNTHTVHTAHRDQSITGDKRLNLETITNGGSHWATGELGACGHSKEHGQPQKQERTVNVRRQHEGIHPHIHSGRLEVQGDTERHSHEQIRGKYKHEAKNRARAVQQACEAIPPSCEHSKAL